MSLRFDIRVGLGAVAICGTLNGCCSHDCKDDPPSKTTFFVTSDTHDNGDLGGLDGADKRCRDLAAAANIKGHTFSAYLSTSEVNAKDRIGKGPWKNARGDQIASDLQQLEGKSGDATLFVTESGDQINGAWEGSPLPSEHAIFTGSTSKGLKLSDETCNDWTSDKATENARFGFSDGIGPTGSTAGDFKSWNSAITKPCDSTSAAASAGRLYCFASDDSR